MDWVSVADGIGSLVGAVGGIGGGYVYWRTQHISASLVADRAHEIEAGVRLTARNRSTFDITVTDIQLSPARAHDSATGAVSVLAVADPQPPQTVPAKDEVHFFMANSLLDGTGGGILQATRDLRLAYRFAIVVRDKRRPVRSKPCRPVI